ncbi:hypothetical protein JAAARDRAFT_60767 [Jaapia argillacea MUCL 33604]|uniref:FAD-binding PCMH-type domain-containing protein n=1 Tax=Jaapia argillacea MUCL 33604 TaxID=933084 RepID=A0A067PHV7_9AGAM|nr:hypothetical protein JAAARDRAFT_60767 [Jaapia argillacea MUCL 33604]
MADFTSFLAAFNGDIVTPSDTGYEHAISRWALNAQRKAKVVAYVKNAEDIALAIKHARVHMLPIAIKGGGHSAAGASSSEGGLIIDLSKYFDTATVDVERELIRIGGGAVWATVDAAAIKEGFATVGGTINHVYCLVLGGGYGWLSPAYGLALDNLVEVTIVTADGSVLVANADSHVDLFWGVRGGGCNFGVCTEFVMKVHRQRATVFGGAIVFTPPLLPALYEATQQWWKNGPSEKEGMYQIFTKDPGGNPCIVAALFYNGSEAEGRDNFKAFFDLEPVGGFCREMPYEQLNSLQNEFTPHGINYYINGAYHHGPDLELATKFFARFTELSANPDFQMNLIFEYISLDKITSVPNDATAFVRGERGNILISTNWKEDSPERSKLGKEMVHELVNLIHGHTGYRKKEEVGYGNYSSESTDGVAFDKAKILFGENYPRLQGLKKRYDPEQIFSKWFPITPA